MASARRQRSDERERLGRTSNANVGTIERWLSVAAGGALAAYGLSRRSLRGALLTLPAGALLYRGVTGRSPLYRALGINTANPNRSPAASVGHGEGVKVERSVTITRPPDELYRFWRNFENLPRFMDHLESVEVIDERRSRWVAKAPAGRRVAWEAEIITERENELIGWRSLAGADVANAGSVHFRPAPGGRGTEVKVVLEYKPPVGPVGGAVARLFGEDPDQQVLEDLRHFKQVMEAGEVPTTDGQPSGRK